MKGEILMENEKTSSRLGVRLSAIVVAVLLVVCMAVPAFAASVDVPASSPYPAFDVDTPEGYDFYLVNPLYFGPGDYGYQILAFSSLPSANQLYVTSAGKLAILTERYSATVNNRGSVSSWTYETNYVNTSFNVSFSEFISGNVRLYNEDCSIFWGPPLPPPDMKDNVTSGLTVVLDWVGATVSALFSGELAGLLPLVAIPVAITILILAIVVIKRSIWGA